MIDLHTHSTASDGCLSPAALIGLAADSGLRLIALTDHDSLEGLPEAEAAARAKGIGFIRGIEMEVAWEPGEFHMLGLDLADLGGELAEATLTMARSRGNRNRLIMDKIREAGIPATMEELRTHAGAGSIGRPHFADMLVKRNAARNRQDAFDKYLAKGRPFYLAKECFPLTEVIRLIHAAGGLAIAAHPLSLFVSWGRLPGILDEWKELGVDGIEAYHPTAKLGQCRRLDALGRARGFRITAGSDYHGNRRPERRLGHTAGKLPIADSYLDEIAR